jgi:hypothetical protein
MSFAEPSLAEKQSTDYPGRKTKTGLYDENHHQNRVDLFPISDGFFHWLPPLVLPRRSGAVG